MISTLIHENSAQIEALKTENTLLKDLNLALNDKDKLQEELLTKEKRIKNIEESYYQVILAPVFPNQIWYWE